MGVADWCVDAATIDQTSSGCGPVGASGQRLRVETYSEAAPREAGWRPREAGWRTLFQFELPEADLQWRHQVDT